MSEGVGKDSKNLIQFLRCTVGRPLEKIETGLAAMKKDAGGSHISLDDAELFNICAGVALQLHLPADEALAKAFAVAKLDHNNPIHWRLLVTCFAQFHFGPAQRRGAPKRWDEVRYSELFKRIQSIMKAKPSLKSWSDLSRALQKRHPNDYGEFSLRHLNRLGHETLDPNKNLTLKRAVDELVLISRVDSERTGHVWTPEAELRAREKWLAYMLELTGMSRLDKKDRN